MVRGGRENYSKDERIGDTEFRFSDDDRNGHTKSLMDVNKINRQTDR